VIPGELKSLLSLGDRKTRGEDATLGPVSMVFESRLELRRRQTMRLLDDLHASCLQLRPLSHMCGPKKPQTPLWETRPVTQMPQLVLNRHAEDYTHFYESAREQKHRGQKTLPWRLSLDQKSRYAVIVIPQSALESVFTHRTRHSRAREVALRCCSRRARKTVSCIGPMRVANLPSQLALRSVTRKQHCPSQSD
jgi:hypothetical protein